jgi:hypothetical protein
METKLNYLLDTCILIDFLRGDASIYDILVKDQNINLSMSMGIELKYWKESIFCPHPL